MKRNKKDFTLLSTIIIMVILIGAPVFSAETTPVTVKTIADNLYLMNDFGYNVNITFLVTEGGVLVVDSGNNPAEGKQIVEKIKEKTDKPIKYVVFTHYHNDHSLGIPGFLKDITLIAQINCTERLIMMRDQMIKPAIETQIPLQIQQQREKVEKLKKENSPDVKKEEQALEELLNAFEIYKAALTISPDMGFEKKVTLYMGKEKIEIMYMGPGHTDGDAIISIPGKKTIIMGDLLFNGMYPYIGMEAGSNTRNWIEILDELSKMDIEKVVPGHGEVAGKEVFQTMKKYLTDLRASVKEAIDKGMTLEDMKKTIKLEEYKNLKWPQMFPENIEAVYKEMTAKKE